MGLVADCIELEIIGDGEMVGQTSHTKGARASCIEQKISQEARAKEYWPGTMSKKYHSIAGGLFGICFSNY